MQNTVKLSPRLQLIADKVIPGAKVADIGTDHAYIPIYLVQKGISDYVIASDVRQGPVRKAIRNVEKYQFHDKINIRLGNGLETIHEREVDTVIIAGMGGVLITEILSNAHFILKDVKRLILQPMLGQEEVRIWLENHHYTIVDEELAKEEHKIYNVIVAEHGYEKIDKPIYYYIGKKLIEKRDPLLPELIQHRMIELENIIHKLIESESPNAKRRLEECEMMLEEYKKLLQYK